MSGCVKAKPTGEILRKLRSLMRDPRVTCVGTGLDAYIVPSCDAHNSEYLADTDMRRAFVSGFDGSAGTAIITLEGKARMWTDGRYYLQATSQMEPDNWALMRQEDASQPEWLKKSLDPGSVVGFDPYLFSVANFSSLRKELSGTGIRLVGVEANLVDRVWGADQPPRPANPVVPLEIQFAGEEWASKVTRVRDAIRAKGCDLLVLSCLDEVAWLLNLRGSDIPNNPVFFSYLALTQNRIVLFINEAQITEDVINHLKTSDPFFQVEIKPYEDIKSFLRDRSFKKVWLSNQASHGLAACVPILPEASTDAANGGGGAAPSGGSDSGGTSVVMEVSPATLMKAIKNPTELKGFEACHIRDGAALTAYLAWLDKNVSKGDITEMSGAQKLLEFRQAMSHFVQISFDTISSSGPNSAVIHYHPRPETDRALTTEEMYLVDSGGQYKDGTTDVTRTVHFGNPTRFQKECFTRVLKGQIRLATAKFPNKCVGSRLDSIARLALWEVGLDYKHGTGHGVGSYLNVHEGPIGISYRPYPDDHGLQKGMILSDEPGFYLDGEFGIRLENLVQVVGADVAHSDKWSSGTGDFLTFDTLTMVPVQSKLILPELLTREELDWLNEYHETCREKVGPVLREMGNTEALNYLVTETKPLG